jgi:hypothetical protein
MNQIYIRLICPKFLTRGKEEEEEEEKEEEMFC